MSGAAGALVHRRHLLELDPWDRVWTLPEEFYVFIVKGQARAKGGGRYEV